MARIAVNWSMDNEHDLTPALTRFKKYLNKIGLKENTIRLYTRLANAYLLEIKKDIPSPEDAEKFYNSLSEKNLSRSAINNFAAAIIKYHAMINKPVELSFLRLNNSLPYYFDETDIIKLFGVLNNLKHKCMMQVLFFGCLRSGELCNLDISDYNPDDLTLRLRETKNNSDALVYINDETVLC